MQMFWVPGRMPGLNEIIEQVARHPSEYRHTKRVWAQTIAVSTRLFEVEPSSGWAITYFFFEPNQRRDPSNFVAGGIKLIEDALVGQRLLPDDGWSQISDIRAHWAAAMSYWVDPGVAVILHERVLDRAEAWMQAERAIDTWKTKMQKLGSRSLAPTSNLTSSAKSAGSSRSSRARKPASASSTTSAGRSTKSATNKPGKSSRPTPRNSARPAPTLRAAPGYGNSKKRETR